MMTYEQARAFVLEETTKGSILGLATIRSLMEELSNVQETLPVIHIGGTNGKGSVGAYLASIFKEAGLHVGRYCSPAVFEELEVWQYDGENMTQSEYAKIMSQVKSACDILLSKGGTMPTAFEVETAAAFLYFAEKKPDVVLLEVGMGGETDATNVISRPLASVLTSISRDHMQFLGETISEIAEVKAGIIKSGCPVVSAAQPKEVARVIENRVKRVWGIRGQGEDTQELSSGIVQDATGGSAQVVPGEIAQDASEESILVVSGENAQVAYGKIAPLTFVKAKLLRFYRQEPGRLEFAYSFPLTTKEGADSVFLKLETAMAGTYQMQNAALAVEVAAALLPGLLEKASSHSREVSENRLSYILQGIKNARWPGRFEVVSKEPLIILDGAHNEGAAKELAKTIENCFTNQPLTYIIGVLADKEHEVMLRELLPYAARVYTVTPPGPRAMKGELLAKEARRCYEDLQSAVGRDTTRGCSVEDAEKFESVGVSVRNVGNFKEAEPRERVRYMGSMEMAIKEAVSFKEPILAWGSLSWLGELKRKVDALFN